jgi:Icc-related predicted phosphoesterase
VKIVAISDTHSMHRKINVPKGDVLVHAGDFSARGRYDEFEDFVRWLSELPHKHKIFIAGNHDECMEKFRQTKPNGFGGQDVIFDMAKTGRIESAEGIHYLFDSSVTIDGKKFYGSPWQPDFCNWSFQAPRGQKMEEKWAAIPLDTDVLITHGPPYGHGDYVPRDKRVTGCLELMNKVTVVQPTVHIFGHIHEGYGYTRSEECKTRFVNASTCNEAYKPINKAFVLQLD